MSSREVHHRPQHRKSLKLTHGDQSVTLHSAAYRRGGGESTQ
jgi:hypothetical protein